MQTTQDLWSEALEAMAAHKAAILDLATARARRAAAPRALGVVEELFPGTGLPAETPDQRPARHLDASMRSGRADRPYRRNHADGGPVRSVRFLPAVGAKEGPVSRSASLHGKPLGPLSQRVAGTAPRRPLNRFRRTRS